MKKTGFKRALSAVLAAVMLLSLIVPGVSAAAPAFSPVTGDTTHMGVWIAVAAVCLVVIAALVIYRSRKNK